MAAIKNLHKRKNTIGRLMDLAKKGNELWNGYGDVVKKSVVAVINKDTSQQSEETSSIHAVKDTRPVSQAVVVEDIDDNTSANSDMISNRSEETGKDTFFEVQQSRLYNVVVKETILSGNLSNPEQCMAALNEIYSVADETIRYCEEQETKRETIRAERDVAIAKIKEMGELVKVYLEKTYDERLAVFTKQFEAIDVAIETGNVEMLAVTLNSMNELASSSPFKNLADISSVQQGLIEQSEWDI